MSRYFNKIGIFGELRTFLSTIFNVLMLFVVKRNDKYHLIRKNKFRPLREV